MYNNDDDDDDDDDDNYYYYYYYYYYYWLPQTEALFDIRVIDTDVQSYSDHSPKEVLRPAEGEKKKNIWLRVRHVLRCLHQFAARLMVCLVMKLMSFEKR